MAAPGFRLGSGPLHGTKLPPFRSEQTSFLSTCLGFPPLQLVLMSFFPPCTMIPTEAVTASHLQPPAAWHGTVTLGGLTERSLDSN